MALVPSSTRNSAISQNQMKKFVDPVTAQTEGDPHRGTNHPWKICCLSNDGNVVSETNAPGFTAARKAAPKLIRGKVTKVLLAGNPDLVPGKFRDAFKKLVIGGREMIGFLVTA